MFSLIAAKVSDPQFLLMVFVAIAASATIVTLAMPLVQTDSLQKRMRNVALEREKIRARERERMNAQSNRPTLRQTPRAYMKDVVDRLNLRHWLGTADAQS